jgi:hypothetical protein
VVAIISRWSVGTGGFSGGGGGTKKFAYNVLSSLDKLFHAFVYRIEQILGTVKFYINIYLQVCPLIFKILGCGVFKKKCRDM